MAYDRDRFDRDRYERDRIDRDRHEHDRGAVERAGDEVRSWFGDDEARRRRERDAREPERNYSAERPYGTRDYRPERSHRWIDESARSESDRDSGDRYGRSYSSPMDRETIRNREIGSGPAFQPYARGSQEFGTEGYGSTANYNRGSAREWRSSEAWRVPGPHAGRGPKGYQRSDERIREELNDRLTAHGLIDATDIDVRIAGGEVTLAGFVDSREAKRAAEDCAEDLQGVREVHNQLRIRSHADDATGVGRTSVLGLTEHETQTADTAPSLDRQTDAASRSRARNT